MSSSKSTGHTSLTRQLRPGLQQSSETRKERQASIRKRQDEAKSKVGVDEMSLGVWDAVSGYVVKLGMCTMHQPHDL
jgi:hypothetical protein